jgi:4-amino-4-deoxy-L-arabinose transferase-like glycosyltransferase
MRKGVTLYRDIHDNKPPLLYVVAAVAQTEFWFKFILLFWHLLTIVVFYKLATFLFSKQSWAPLIASSAVALLTLLPEGNIANGEIFMILPVIIGMVLILRASKPVIARSPMFVEGRRGNLNVIADRHGRQSVLAITFWSGVLFAVGFLFKVPAAFDFSAAFVFIVFFREVDVRASLRKIFDPSVLLFIAGFVLPIALSVAYYATKGAFTPYVRSALLQNIGYLGSWSAGKQSLITTITHSGLVLRTVLLLLSTAVLWWARSRVKLSIPLQFSALWFLFALYGALLSERPYPHYLIQPAVPAALILTLLIYEKKRGAQVALLALGATGILSYYKFGFWNYPIVPYYQNFLNWTLKRETTEQYFSYFGNQVNRTYKVAKYLKLLTRPEDRIFIWGDEPSIYALSNRLPAGRYTAAYHVVDFNGYEETISAIRDRKPPIVIIFSGESRPFPQLFSELSSWYIPTTMIDDATIYQRTK